MTEAVVHPTVTRLSAAELLAGALALPRDARAKIVEELLESLDESDAAEIEQAWREETRRRYQQVKDGTAILHDGEEVLREARRMVGL